MDSPPAVLRVPQWARGGAMGAQAVKRLRDLWQRGIPQVRVSICQVKGARVGVGRGGQGTLLLPVGQE